MREKLPFDRSARFPERSELRRVIAGIALVILALVVWAALRGR
jgi:hypothetical protein